MLKKLSTVTRIKIFQIKKYKLKAFHTLNSCKMARKKISTNAYKEKQLIISVDEKNLKTVVLQFNNKYIFNLISP